MMKRSVAEFDFVAIAYVKLPPAVSRVIRQSVNPSIIHNSR
jgi:hypothetical protein